jgi:hypothetical protein
VVGARGHDDENMMIRAEGTKQARKDRGSTLEERKS